MSRIEPARWVPVLLYHRVAPPPSADPYRNFVTPGTFESHLRWLRARGYTSISLVQLADMLAGTATSPSRPIAITFDDGYLDNHNHAFPLLCRYGFAATVFLVSDAIGGDSSFDAASGYEPAPMLGQKEIREMAAAGVEFGSHSATHPASLVDLDDGRLRHEVGASRRAIESVLDGPVEVFAFPHSRHDERVESVVADAGYRLACAGVGTRFEPFCISRVAAPQAGGLAVQVAAGWRRLKWRARSVLDGRAREAA